MRNEATDPMTDAHRKHKKYRLLLSFAGTVVSVGILWWVSEGGQVGWVPKVADAFASALLFAAVTGFATAALHRISGVEREVLARLGRNESAQPATDGVRGSANA